MDINGMSLFTTTITKMDFDDYINSRPATDFINPPETIEINGITFSNIHNNILFDNKGKKIFLADYQSNVPDVKGEYPVILIRIKEKKKRKGVMYEYDRSPVFGTRLELI